MILGTGIGGLAEILAGGETLERRGPRRVSPFCVPKIMSNSASRWLAIRMGLRGLASPPQPPARRRRGRLGLALDTIRCGRASFVFTGGTEAALTGWRWPATARRGPSHGGNDRPERSRPFDRDRDGFVFLEGAGILVFEERGHARARGGAEVLAEVWASG